MKGETQMMEYAKDEIFTIHYPIKKDKREYPIQKKMREKIREHKVLSLFFLMGIIFTILDITFIYCFFSLLTKI